MHKSYQLAELVYNCNPISRSGVSLKLLDDFRLWTFTRNLWTSKGVYVVQESHRNSKPVSIEKLESFLKRPSVVNGIKFSKTNKVVFIPKGNYQLGEHTPESFATDWFVNATFGYIGADKLSLVSRTFKDNPYIYGHNVSEGEEPIQTLSALDAPFISNRLILHGNNHMDFKLVYTLPIETYF